MLSAIWYSKVNAHSNSSFVNRHRKVYSACSPLKGVIEVYGAAGSDGKRELLGRANIQLLRGDFMPKMSNCNITGSVNITDLQFSSSHFTSS